MCVRANIVKPIKAQLGKTKANNMIRVHINMWKRMIRQTIF